MVSNFTPRSQHQLDEDLKTMYASKLKIVKKWKDADLTALLCPVYPIAAPKISNIKSIGFMGDYIGIWNMFGFPAGIVPITKVKKGETTSYVDTHDDIITRDIKQDMIDSEGMPLGVQIIGYPFEDESVLAVMQSLDA